jgi:DNA-binding HxlR family transcriptional regulator
VQAAVPPRVDYELTDLGRSLLGVINGLQTWATSHMADVLAAQAAYDTRA